MSKRILSRISSKDLKVSTDCQWIYIFNGKHYLNEKASWAQQLVNLSSKWTFSHMAEQSSKLLPFTIDGDGRLFIRRITKEKKRELEMKLNETYSSDLTTEIKENFKKFLTWFNNEFNSNGNIRSINYENFEKVM